jgi:hypothetical protein
MISSPTIRDDAHNGLITYLFHQLKTSNISLFQDYIRKEHILFQEGKLPNITVVILINNIEEKIRFLKHAGEWIEQDPNQPSMMALAAASQIPPKMEELMLKHIQMQLQQMVDRQRLSLNSKHSSGSYHEWKHNPPKTAGEIKLYNGKQFKWCTKCNQGKGQWASAHDYDTHVDGFHSTKSPTSGH